MPKKGSSFVHKILNGQESQTEGSIDLRLVCLKCVQEARQCQENVNIADEKSILHSAALSLDQSFILAFSNINNTILEWSRALEGGTLVGWLKD